MSATFRLEKKKATQQELRRLMQEQRQSRNGETTNKIESPFAKYENDGLFCTLCKSKVKSEKVWQVHVNAKQHKEKLAQAKELKAKIETQTTAVVKKEDPGEKLRNLKRSIEEFRSDLPEKKLKSILKNSSNSAVTSNNSMPSTKVTSTKDETPMQTDDPLPEGFFDDPVKDAKIRNQDYKDANEEEWERFQKEIKEAEALSKVLINEEHEEATVERQLDEIDEQIRNWSRVLEMEKKKEKIESKLKEVIENKDVKMASDVESGDDDDDDEVPEFLDWRMKKSHK